MHRSEAAREIVLCCRRLWQAGLIAGQDGNVSVRYRPDRLLVTPRGLAKSDLAPEDLVDVDLDGRHLGGSRQASTELDLHLRVYRRRPDCGAVVHAHPPTATAFAVAGEGIPANVLPEVALLMGEVPRGALRHDRHARAGRRRRAVPRGARGRAAGQSRRGCLGSGRSRRHVSAWKAWSTRPGSSWPPAASAGSPA